MKQQQEKWDEAKYLVFVDYDFFFYFFYEVHWFFYFLRTWNLIFFICEGRTCGYLMWVLELARSLKLDLVHPFTLHRVSI